jgi:broad specificity phosphatase PhoE
MKKDIYVFRHGETDCNKDGVIQGQKNDNPLNETGRTQARRLAENMKDIKIDAVVASPLLRAFETGEILAKSKNIPILKDDRLKEANFGIYEGRKKSEMSDKELKEIWDTVDIPGGEHWHAVRERALAALADIVKMPYDSFGIATHGRVMASMLYGLGMTEVPFILNTTLAHICFEDGKLYVRALSQDGGVGFSIIDFKSHG